MEAGCRVVTGGQQGVMGWALRGARSALNFREGDTLAILPGSGPAEASEHAAWGWVLPSGERDHESMRP